MEILFVKAIHRILSHSNLSGAELSFWKLLILGQYGPYSLKWVESFKEFFALHLLVLSGTQLNGLIKFWKTATFWCKTRYRIGAFKIFLLSNLLLWLMATGWPAPLVRASLLCLGSYSFPRFNINFRISMVLLIHVLLFPGHLKTPGFFLSWLCYLCLLICQSNFKKNAMLMTHLACWLLGWCIFNFHFQSFKHLIVAFCGSFVLAMVFDALLLPFIGLVLGLAFLTISFSEKARIFDAIFAPFLKGATQLIVVVEAIFRYILRYDL